MASRFFHASVIRRPEDVIPYLAEGERHWRKGFSAYELACSWVECGDIPPKVRETLRSSPVFAEAVLVEGLFEREVDLGTKGRPSQTDLLVLVRLVSGFGVIAVEGKVDEPFGPVVGKWLDGSPGRTARLAALCRTLGLDPQAVGHLRYQLFHRAASAVYEAQRYGCDKALMLVHSFSPGRTSFGDFEAFAAALGLPLREPGTISGTVRRDRVDLALGWVADVPSA